MESAPRRYSAFNFIRTNARFLLPSYISRVPNIYPNVKASRDQTKPTDFAPNIWLYNVLIYTRSFLIYDLYCVTCNHTWYQLCYMQSHMISTALHAITHDLYCVTCNHTRSLLRYMQSHRISTALHAITHYLYCVTCNHTWSLLRYLQSHMISTALHAITHDLNCVA